MWTQSNKCLNNNKSNDINKELWWIKSEKCNESSSLSNIVCKSTQYTASINKNLDDTFGIPYLVCNFEFDIIFKNIYLELIRYLTVLDCEYYVFEIIYKDNNKPIELIKNIFDKKWIFKGKNIKKIKFHYMTFKRLNENPFKFEIYKYVLSTYMIILIIFFSILLIVLLFILYIKIVQKCNKRNERNDISSNRTNSNQQNEILLNKQKLIKLFSTKLKPIYYNQKMNIFNDNCTICLNNFFRGQKIIRLNCEHIFHEKCLKKYLKNNLKNPKCPNCNKSILNYSKKEIKIKKTPNIQNILILNSNLSSERNNLKNYISRQSTDPNLNPKINSIVNENEITAYKISAGTELETPKEINDLNSKITI